MSTNTDFKIIIQNCVASVNLFTKINLISIYQQLIDHDVFFVKYIPKQFPGLILKIPHPKTSTLVFASGKLVVTGAKSTTLVYDTVQAVIDILKECGTEITEELCLASRVTFRVFGR